MEIVVVLIGALLIYFLHRGVYRKYWNYGLNLSLRYGKSSAFEGEEVEIIEVLTNSKLLPMPWVMVRFQLSKNLIFSDDGHSRVSDYYYRSDLFSILMRQRITRRLPFKCGKRGYYTIKSADLVSTNILGTDRFAQRADCSAFLTVYPSYADARELELPFKRISGSVAARRFINPDPFEFRAIREYLPADSLKDINFKATAKTGTLMSNEFNQTLSREMVLILNLQKYRERTTEDLFEQSIRLAATLSDMVIEQGVSLGFYTNGRDIVTGEETVCQEGSGTSQLYNILEGLARIDLSQSARPGAELLDEITVTGGQEPVYVLISPYYGEDLREAFERHSMEAFDFIWIIPCGGTDAGAKASEADGVYLWEAGV